MYMCYGIETVFFSELCALGKLRKPLWFRKIKRENGLHGANNKELIAKNTSIFHQRFVNPSLSSHII